MRIGGPEIQSQELAQFLSVFLADSNQRIQEIDDQRDRLEVRVGIFTDLKTKLTKLKRLADDLNQIGGLSKFRTKKVESSDTKILTATAATGASALNHSIHVEQLARAHSVISNRYTSSGTDISSTMSGTKTFSIDVDGTSYAVSVTIQAGDTNEQVMDAIVTAVNNVAGIPVRAGKVGDTDSTHKLSLASTETGTTNKMTFTDTDGLLGALGLSNATAATDTVGGYVYADLGNNELDAILTVDGVRVTRSENTLSDVLPGVTLELHAAQNPTDPDVALDVTTDQEAVKKTLEEFLEAYNDVQGYLADKLKVNPDTFERGDLAGDFTYASLLQRMRLDMSSAVSTATDSTVFSLTQVGITASDSGKFSITDTSKLEKVIAENPTALESLFNTADGIGGRLEALLDQYTSSDGIIRNSKDSAKRQMENLEDRKDRLLALQEKKREQLIQQFGAIQEAQIAQSSLMTMLSAFTQSLA